MKRIIQTQIPSQTTLAAALAACLCLGVSAPLLAAPPVVTAAAQAQPRNTFEASNNKAARKCLADLSLFDSQMQKDGYWLHGYGDRYGYPIYGYSYDERGTLPPNGSLGATSYWRMRPGYEVRTLFASATILGQRGQQQECEAMLDATRGVFTRTMPRTSEKGTRRWVTAWIGGGSKSPPPSLLPATTWHSVPINSLELRWSICRTYIWAALWISC